MIDRASHQRTKEEIQAALTDLKAVLPSDAVQETRECLQLGELDLALELIWGTLKYEQIPIPRDQAKRLTKLAMGMRIYGDEEMCEPGSLLITEE